MRQINQQLDEKASISTTSVNKWVLLTGQVTDENSRVAAEKIATNTQNVRKVFNEVTVAWPSTVGNHASDSLTTSKVKSRLLNPEQPGISGHHVKIVTELGVVYLMGRITQREGQLAGEVTRGVGGVQKVVKVFEYITEDEFKQLNNVPENQNRK